MDLATQWAREGRVPPDALLVPADGSPVRSVLSEPALKAIVQPLLVAQSAAAPEPGAKPTLATPIAQATPPTISTGVSPAQGDDALSVLIPYKNPHALIGYYVSIAALIPLVGLLAGPLAIWYGIVGIRRRSKNPQMHGLAHAWIAIVLGSIGLLISLGCGLSIIVAIVSDRSGY